MGTDSTAGTSRLTDMDQRIIRRARDLAAAAEEGPAALREHTGENDYPWIAAFGTARYLLPELVAIIERLDSAPAAGYIVDGKPWHPSDVTIVRQES